MRKLSLFVIFSIILMLLNACGIAYDINRKELARTATEEDFGPKPPDNHQEIEKSIILGRLKDPQSAQIEWKGIGKDIIQ